MKTLEDQFNKNLEEQGIKLKVIIKMFSTFLWKAFCVVVLSIFVHYKINTQKLLNLDVIRAF
jgi:hypothetical protein